MALSLERILHPSDFSQASEYAFAHSLRLALDGRSSLEILHVDSSGRSSWDEFPSVREVLARWGLLTSADVERAEVEALGVRIQKTRVRRDDPVRGLLARIEEEPASLIVLAPHRRQRPLDWLRREVGRTVARSANIPALFVPEGARGFVDDRTGTVNLRRILVPIDAHPAPGPAVDAGASLAQALGCDAVELELLHVGHELPALRLPARPGITIQSVVRSGHVVDEILAAAESVDLIVVATHGREGFLDALRGSTTEQIVSRAPTAVLAIPA